MVKTVKILVAAILSLQIADIITTVIALHSRLYEEANPLMHTLLSINHIAPYIIKMAVVAAVVAVALTLRRAKLALSALVALSLYAPIANTIMLLRNN